MGLLIRFFTNLFPGLEQELRIAHIQKKTEVFMKQTLNLSVFVTVVLFFITFFFMGAFSNSKTEALFISLFVLTPIYFFLSFAYMVNLPKIYIRKRQREINKEVLFAGRYLLVKLESGEPLYNSLEDASDSYGIASKYFQEMVDDIKLGTPIEDAMSKARENSPSNYFKMILSEIITSLKTGVDVSIPLRSILIQITKEQMMEIKEYGKKLNAFIMIYMVVATVIPSLGMTIFIIIAGFMGLALDNKFIISTLFFFAFIQYMFIASLKSIRPLVNI